MTYGQEARELSRNRFPESTFTRQQVPLGFYADSFEPRS